MQACGKMNIEINNIYVYILISILVYMTICMCIFINKCIHIYIGVKLGPGCVCLSFQNFSPHFFHPPFSVQLFFSIATRQGPSFLSVDGPSIFRRGSHQSMANSKIQHGCKRSLSWVETVCILLSYLIIYINKYRYIFVYPNLQR